MQERQDVYVVAMKRSFMASVTAGGETKPNTSCISSLSPTDFAGQTLEALFADGIIRPEDVQFFFFGSAISVKKERTLYQAPHKFVFRAGCGRKNIPVVGATVEKACSTGLKAIWLAAKKIAVGKADITIGGGLDMMSRQSNSTILAGLTDPTTGKLMAELADEKAIELKLEELEKSDLESEAKRTVAIKGAREDHDAFALGSYECAKRHMHDQKYAVPTRLTRDANPVLTCDEEINTYWDRLHLMRKMRPRDKTITILNSSKYADGNGFLALASPDAVREKRLTPLARIVEYAEWSEREPKDFITAPIGAVKKVLQLAGLKASDIDIWESNEAFPPAPLALMKEFGLSRDQVNPRGGAIADGHPIGGTGPIRAIKGIGELHESGKRYLLLVICNATGEATAIIFERC